MMNANSQNQDESVEKIHREEGLDDNENDYNLSETLSDSNQRDAEEKEDTEEEDNTEET